MKLRKGNVFTSVCQEFCPGGVYPSMHWIHPPGRHLPSRHPHPPGQTPWEDTPPGRHPPGKTPPPSGQTPPGQTPHPLTATAVDGTHPTGMHSSSCCSETVTIVLFCLCYSPSGKLVQIEYALAAVAAGAPSVGIKGGSLFLQKIDILDTKMIKLTLLLSVKFI